MAINRLIIDSVNTLISVSTKSELTHKHAAAILGPGGRILCTGFNMHKGMQFIHAEVSAICNYLSIRRIRYDLRSKL